METARPHEGQKRTFSEDKVPQPGQVTMRTDCIAPRGEAVKPHVWNRPGSRKQILSNRLLFTSHPAGHLAGSRQAGSYPTICADLSGYG